MKYKTAFEQTIFGSGNYDYDVEAKIDRVFEILSFELRAKYGPFDRRGELLTLTGCEAKAAVSLVWKAMEWKKYEGRASMLPRAELLLSEALEELSLTPEPKAWPKGMGARYAPYNWYVAKAIVVFWQLEIEALTGKKTPTGPPAPSFGEGLANVARDALEKRKLLDAKTGHFTGNHTHVRAMFVVLRQRGYLPKKSKIQAAKILAALFAAQFNFEFAPRTVTTAEKERTEGQDREETKFLGAIPEKK